MIRTSRAFTMAAAILWCATQAFAVRIEHATIERRPVHGAVADTIANAAGPSGSRWITWDVPSNDPESTMCCFSSIDRDGISPSRCGTCRLDERGGAVAERSDGNGGGPELRSDGTFAVFLRVEHGQPAAVRMFSSTCTVDAGGESLVQLESVTPEASVTYLASIASAVARSGGKRRDAGPAIAAIGMHRASNVVSTLASLISSNAADDLRGQAAFWLGMKGGAEGRDILRRAIDADPSTDFRHQAIAGIAQDRSRDAIDLLVSLARNHPSPDVRRQSLFWLGQRAGEKAAEELKSATADPNDDVKEMAVFAISQLPRERAVPELIEIARTNRSRAARERAVFWLGQSGDPRALDFIESLLTKP